MPAQSTRILLIEDEALVALSLSKDLERMGYEVTGIANCVADAILLAHEQLPDLVLSDIQLKDDDLDGIDAARCLKALYDIPVLFVSGRTDAETYRRASETSPSAYLMKPLRMSELEANLEIALAGTKVERALGSISMIQLLCDEVFVWDLDRDWMRYAQKWNHGIHRTAEPASAFFYEQIHPEDRPDARALLTYHLEQKTPQFDLEYRILRPDHTYVWSRFRGALLSSPRSGFKFLVGMHTDVNDRRLAEESLLRGAFQDPFTEMGNRFYFSDRLHDAFAECTKKDKELGVLFFTLEGLREINEVDGHEQGDAILRVLSQRLRAEMRPDETVARYSGAEFVALLAGDRPNEIDGRVQSLLSLVRTPLRSNERTYQLNARYGLSLGPSGSSTADGMLSKAEAAWRKATLLKPQAAIGTDFESRESRAAG